MSKITWVQHPEFANRLVAVKDDAHAAWIITVNWGGHTSYLVKSWIRKLNGPQFATQELAKEWVETQLANESIDKDTEIAGSGNLRIADLDRVKHLVKVKKLAELAGLNPSTIAQKVARRSELSVSESEAMTRTLIEAGIVVTSRPSV